MILRIKNMRPNSVLLLMSCAVLLSESIALAQAPTISIISNLNFGTNLTGSTTINYNNASASEFSVQWPTYPASEPNTVTFTLPGYLTDSYGDQLPITFNSTNYGAYRVGTNSPTGATTFNPVSGLSASAGAAAHTTYFWIGGQINPSANYTAATYTGTITVTIVVTVNGTPYTTSQSFTATASLSGSVSLSATGSLAFGIIVAGTSPPVLDPKAAGAPMFTATGVRTTSTVQYASSSTLNDGYGHTLTFTPSVNGSSTTQAASVPKASGSSLGSTSGGRFYFWLGGTLSALPANQPAGNYNGVFALRITY